MPEPMPETGYTDTPKIPGSEWCVHDGRRPQPDVVMPPAEPGGPPADARVLFDGGDLSGFVGKDGGPAPWKVENGYAEVVPGSGDIFSKEKIGDAQLHLEWAAPVDDDGEGQGRGNSGVFLMSRYEIQVLDNYQNPTYPDGTCGAIYGQCPPRVNACRPPGAWQSYDIIWVAPRFSGGKLVSPARVTVIQNGVLIHHDQELIGPTAHKTVAEYEPHEPAEPLELQDHGDLVRFRNIWYRPLDGTGQR